VLTLNEIIGTPARRTGEWNFMVEIIKVWNSHRRPLVELVLNSQPVLVFDVISEIFPSDGAKIYTKEINPFDSRRSLQLDRSFEIAKMFLIRI
jgi:hypothetical protein